MIADISETWFAVVGLVAIVAIVFGRGFRFRADSKRLDLQIGDDRRQDDA